MANWEDLVTSCNKCSIDARKTFRSLVKHAENQATVDHYINIEKLKKIKPKTYWKEMKILNNKPKKLYTINGKTTHSDIANEFGEHFNNFLNTYFTSITEYFNLSH